MMKQEQPAGMEGEMKAGVLEQLEVEQARAVLAKHGHSHLFAAGVAAGVVAERERAEAEAGTGAIETGKVSSSSPHARRSKTSSERLLLFGPEEGSDNASDEASDDDDDNKDEQDQGQGQPAGKEKTKRKRELKHQDKQVKSEVNKQWETQSLGGGSNISRSTNGRFEAKYKAGDRTTSGVIIKEITESQWCLIDRDKKGNIVYRCLNCTKAPKVMKSDRKKHSCKGV